MWIAIRTYTEQRVGWCKDSRFICLILLTCLFALAPVLVVAAIRIAPTTTLLNPNAPYNDDFGAAVALSEDGAILVVGAPETVTTTASGSVAQVGRVYVFVRHNGHFDQQPARVLDDPDPLQLDEFGARLAISGDGDTVLVSAPGGYDGIPRVYVFDRASGALLATLESPDNGGDCFGQSLALSGDGRTALVGADCASVAGVQWAGKVYLYSRGAGDWPSLPMLTLTEALPARNDFFGTSVALSGDGATALIGGDNYSSDDPIGRAYVFTRQAGVWNRQPEAILSDPAALPGSMFGSTVAVSGDGTRAVVGAGNGASGQSAYVFQQKQGDWTKAAAFAAPTAQTGSGFVNALALSSDGNTALAGLLTGTGVVQVFVCGDDWPQQATHLLSNPTAVNGDAYGWSAALSADGRVRVVGAPYAVSQPSPAGSFFSSMPGPGQVYIYDLQSDAAVSSASGGAGTVAPGGLVVLAVVLWLTRQRHQHRHAIG